jgi:hypothetical protein
MAKVLKHRYDNVTGEYLGSVAARVDPLESKKAGETVYVRIPNASDLAPPPTKENEAACFVDKKWVIKPDFRGLEVLDADGANVVITEIGVPEPPPVGDNEAVCLINGGWVIKPDFRETSFYDKQTGAPVEPLAFGEAPGSGITDQKPPDDVSTWDTVKNKWTKDPVKEKAKKQQETVAALLNLGTHSIDILAEVIAASGIEGQLSQETRDILGTHATLKQELIDNA